MARFIFSFISLFVFLSLSDNIYAEDNSFETDLDSKCDKISYAKIDYTDFIKLGIESWDDLITKVGGLEIKWNAVYYGGLRANFFVNGKYIDAGEQPPAISINNNMHNSKLAYLEVSHSIPLYKVKRVYFISSEYRNLFYRSDMSTYGDGAVVVIITK